MALIEGDREKAVEAAGQWALLHGVRSIVLMA
jgi:hypothetical protein